MKPMIRTRLLALALVALGSAAQAGTVESRFGATDGLGIGLASGDSFQYFDLINPQADGTDDWLAGGFSAQVGAAWTGTLVGASLQVFAGGWGLGGDAGVYLNNQLVGQLTNGDSGAGDYNRAWLDTFDLGAYIGAISANNTIEIRTADPDDGGSLGFFKLTLQTQDAGGGNTVPEPGSAVLALAAVASAALAGRRRRQV